MADFPDKNTPNLEEAARGTMRYLYQLLEDLKKRIAALEAKLP